MKTDYRIIDGKRYNIQTAAHVASYWNGVCGSDFRYVQEDLFLTPKGNWFLVGEGGALSKYARSCGNNSTCGGVEWLPFSADQAFEWLERHHETEKLEKYFSDRIEEA